MRALGSIFHRGNEVKSLLAALGVVLVALGSLLWRSRPFLVVLGAVLGDLGPLLAALGWSWSSWVALGAILGRSWVALGPSWVALGRCWGDMLSVRVHVCVPAFFDNFRSWLFLDGLGLPCSS